MRIQISSQTLFFREKGVANKSISHSAQPIGGVSRWNGQRQGWKPVKKAHTRGTTTSTWTVPRKAQNFSRIQLFFNVVHMSCFSKMEAKEECTKKNPHIWALFEDYWLLFDWRISCDLLGRFANEKAWLVSRLRDLWRLPCAEMDLLYVNKTIELLRNLCCMEFPTVHLKSKSQLKLLISLIKICQQQDWLLDKIWPQ